MIESEQLFMAVSKQLCRYAREGFERRVPMLGARRQEIMQGMAHCTEEERVLMQFLYGTMPLRDAGEYGFDLFLSFVRHALMVYETMEWCREIPEDIFLHYILYYRINSENIEDCRRFFYDRVIGRIRGLTAREAALELNYWCAENGAYESSDDRTISPMTFYRSGTGRCGEESTFAVTVFRSVGIPARQVYTPRWAHCDDNHAWVEVYVDGAWHFLGACEPEEVLDKGWFTNASSRAMLVHTQTFSDYTLKTGEDGDFQYAVDLKETEAEYLGRDERLTYYNHTFHYAQTKRYHIQVLDGEGNPAERAGVSVQLLNMAEYCTMAFLITDQEGKASITIGLGDILLHAQKGSQWCEAVCSVKNTDHAILILRESVGQQRVPLDRWEAIELQAPKDHPMHPVTLTGEQKEINRARLRACARLRKLRIDGAYKEELAGRYPEEQEILRAAAGNFDEIYEFLSRDENPDRRALLHSLSVKDYKDARAEILERHLAGAARYRNQWAEQGELDIFVKYIMCPRIYLEEMTDYRGRIAAFFSREEKEGFREDPGNVWKYIEEHVRYVEEEDYQTICSTPVGSLQLMWGSPLSQRLLFVGICRTLGIPARINPVNEEAEAYVNGEFISITGRNRMERSLGSVILKTTDADRWKYYQTWTIGRLKGEHFVTLNYTGVRFRDGRLSLELEPGNYRLITSNRLPGGNQRASEYWFELHPGQVKEIDMQFCAGSLQDMLVEYWLDDFAVTADGISTSAASLLEGRTNLLAFLEEGQEPTEHVLNEILEQQEEFAALLRDRQNPLQLFFVLRSREARENRTLCSVLEAVPGIQVIYGDFDQIVEPLARRMYVDPDKLPLLIVTEPGRRAIYGCSGYQAGSVELITRLIRRCGKAGNGGICYLDF